MSRLVCLLITVFWLVVCAPPGVAQRFRARPKSLVDTMAADAALNDIFMLDARLGWAVGDRGVILATSDGGRHWLRQASPVVSPLSAVWFVDELHGWVVGGATVPYTHSTRGVALHTSDGGLSWRRLPTPMLPALADVRFFDARRGLAVGQGSTLFPSGLFQTHDGGRRWDPAPTDQANHWHATTYLSAGEGLLVGEGGAAAAVTRGDFSPQSLPDHAGRACRGVALLRDGRGWLVGDRGLLLTTADAGRSWASPTGAAPLGQQRDFDFSDVAAQGEHVWTVGSPGTMVLHSDSTGRSWGLQATNVTAPLRAITFLNERRGWAVGGFGTIIATEDGGRTWSVQRAGGQRSAALVLAPTSQDMPLELIAKLGAAEGYLTAGVAMFAESGDASHEQRRFREAVVGAGAALADVQQGFPLAPSQRAASSSALAALLDERFEEGGVQALSARLADLIARRRPDVVLVAPSPHRGLTQLLESALLEAHATVDVAVKPKRVLRIVKDHRQGGAGVVTGDFESAIGGSLRQWVDPYRGLLQREPAPAITHLGWTPLSGATPSGGRGDPLAGLVIDHGGPARRPFATPPANRLAEWKAVAQKQAEFDALVALSTGGGEWANRALHLTGGLNADSGARQLLRLAMEYRRQGKSRLAADASYLLARRYAEHPLADQPVRWLLTYYAGSETAHAANHANRTRPIATLGNVPAGFETPPDQPWQEVLPLTEHHERAQKLGGYVELARPAMFADPGTRLLLATVARAGGESDREAVLLAPLRRNAAPAAWRRCAEAERWLADRTGAAPKPALQAAVAGERPLLDGVLDEPFWSGASIAALPSGDDPSGATVRIARDDAFLYLAIAANKIPEAAYPSDRSPRPRDADLRGYDRVCLRLDVDRDYATAFELTVDCRGWTHDACWCDENWSPRWYVASQAGEDHWTVEAAIPLEEFSPETPTKETAWAISLERHAPGRFPQPWTIATFEDRTPDAFGLLLFDATVGAR